MRADGRLLVTLEENNLAGGFAAGVIEALASAGLSMERLVTLGLPDDFVTHGNRTDLLAEVGLDADGVARRIQAELARR